MGFGKVLGNCKEMPEAPANSGEGDRSSRWRHLLLNLLLLGCSILVSLSAGELLLQRYYPVG
jgi:hypothetical protein